MCVLGFEIGNGWILSLICLLISYLPMLFNKKGAKRLAEFSWISARGKLMSVVLMVLFFAVLVYPVFLRVRFASDLFAPGAAVFALSGLGTIAAYTAYFTTPLNEPICKGIYRVSRNPVYVSVAGMMLGIALMCHSVLIVGITVLQLLLQHPIILEEEAYCRKIHGKNYLEYFEKVPRYLLFF